MRKRWRDQHASALTQSARNRLRTERVGANQPDRSVLLGGPQRQHDGARSLQVLRHLRRGAEGELHGDGLVRLALTLMTRHPALERAHAPGSEQDEYQILKHQHRVDLERAIFGHIKFIGAACQFLKTDHRDQ